jgi:hypothetical protein
MIYNSYDSLKDKILKQEDIINFGIEGCTHYKVCENFLENITQKNLSDTYTNDYIFKVLKADKSKLSKICYEKVVNMYKELPYFPECEENEETTFISLTNITLALFQIKEHSYKSIWDD